jgi:hypothetical protein
MLGRWPRVNREFVDDSPPHAEQPIKAFRIHLDVPIDDDDVFTRLRAAVKNNDLKNALQILKDYLKPGPAQDHAWRLVVAALSE